ncbi:MAG: biopolymer transport protein ExbD [Planctomycetota bacterium]|jgi:biopolymer transport protein ExbD
MRSLLISLITVLGASSIAAQAATPKTRKSLAEGLVRHCIERDKLTPPHMESGLEMGTGKGDIVLMVRRADGSLHLEALPRGLGDHGPAAEIKDAALGIEEEKEVGAKPKPGKPKAAPGVQVNTLIIKRTKNKVTVTTSADQTPIEGPKVDRAKLEQQLRKRFAITKDPTVEAVLIAKVDADATMQDFLTCWEVARLAGFSVVMLSPTGKVRTSTQEERALIAGIAKKFEWTAENRNGRPLYNGELLILLDGPTRFGDVAPLIIQCAHEGIWQIAFAGQKNAKQRFKLPTHLPTDS